VSGRVDSALGRVLSASLLTGIGTALPALVFVVSSPWLLGRLGADRFGALALLTTIAFLASTLDGGVGASLPRFLGVARGAEDGRWARQLVNTSLALSVAASVLLGGALAGVGYAGAHLLRTPEAVRTETSSLAGWLGMLVVLQLVGGTFQSVLVAYERFGSSAVAAIAGSAAYVAGMVVLVPAYGLAGAFAASAVRAAVTVAAAGWQAVRLVPGRGCGFLGRTQARELLSYAWRTQIGGLAMLVNAEADTLVVASFLPLHEAAMFSLAVTVSTTIRSIPLWAMPYLLTRMSLHTARDGTSGAVALYDRVQRAWAPFLVTFGVVTLGALVPSVSLWLGPGHGKVALIAAVLSAGYLVNLLSAPLAATARATGYPGLESRYGVVAVVVNVATTVPLAIWAGSVGVALGTAIGCLLGTAYFAHLMRAVVRGAWYRLLLPRGMSVAPVLAATATVAGVLPSCLAGLPSDRWGSGTTALLVGGLASAAAVLATRAERRGASGARPSRHPAAAA